MIAQTLQCHSCGAAVSSDAPNCGHCGARLAAICCPACFGMMFQGAKFCPHCGGPAAQWEGADSQRPCPSCQTSMLQGKLRDLPLHECPKCFGLWLDTVTFGQICRNAETQSLVLGAAQQISGGHDLGPVRYLRCPHCRELMHRLNFARCSGVIVDVCRAHGTWFDANELHRIVHFIREGGLDRARAKEKLDLAEEQRRLRAARFERDPLPVHDPGTDARLDLLSAVVGAAGSVLGAWLRK